VSQRLGILDWGIGGVGVLRELRRQAPRIPVVYWSDAGYSPYGLLTSEALSQRVTVVLTRMVELGATSLIVACNAASTVLDGQRPHDRLGVPVSGMIAPALGLVQSLPARTVGVIGGERTIRSRSYRRGLERRGRRVLQRIAQPLSAHVEGGRAGSRRCAADLERILAPLRAVDVLLLACTHYPALSAQIAARVPRALLLDPAASVVEQALSSAVLPRSRARDLVLTTGDPGRMRAAAQRAWGVDLGRCLRVRLR
jgi:glutamate racemase